MCCSSSTEATSMIISGGGTREYRAEKEHSRAEQEHSAEEEHILGQRRETLVARLGAEQQDLCGGSLDDHASLSWSA